MEHIAPMRTCWDERHSARAPVSITANIETKTHTLEWRCDICGHEWTEPDIAPSFIGEMMPVWVRRTGYGASLIRQGLPSVLLMMGRT